MLGQRRIAAADSRAAIRETLPNFQVNFSELLSLFRHSRQKWQRWSRVPRPLASFVYCRDAITRTHHDTTYHSHRCCPIRTEIHPFQLLKHGKFDDSVSKSDCSASRVAPVERRSLSSIPRRRCLSRSQRFPSTPLQERL